MKLKRYLSVALAIIMVIVISTGCTQTPPTSEADTQETTNLVQAVYTPGSYEATVSSMGGPLQLQVTVSEDKITEVNVLSSVDTPGISHNAIKNVTAAIVEKQSLAVDTVTGATFTSRAILNAAEKCLTEAGADVASLKTPLQRTPEVDAEYTADVVIVGGGGAGVSAAVTSLEKGVSVILVEKAGYLGGNSIVAGGIYNTANPEMQSKVETTEATEELIAQALAETPVNDDHKALIEKVKQEYEEFRAADETTLFDSASWHALQTWNGGDKVADIKMVQVLTNNALDALAWVKGMGMKFTDRIGQGAGALYERTHFPEMPNGTGYFDVFEKKLAEAQNYQQLLNTTAESLIMDGNKVIGVNAVGVDGNKITLMANKGVVLATGGFAGNVELRQRFCEGEKWPDLGASLNTSNMPSVTGDGIFMAEVAGAQLVNMEQIQLLHICNPYTGATEDICGPQSAAGYLFINQEGKRFVREDGRRDDISLAIIDQPESIMYLVQSSDVIPDPDTAKTLGGKTVTYMIENNLSGYVVADTLEELAAMINVPADALKESVDTYNTHIDSQEPDEFGRTLFKIKQETGPWYAYPRKPAAHHTMGGVLIDEETRALDANGSPIPGLYCAGEITGVIHGGNRLGGNAIVDFIVFGRIAGASAAEGK